jgi:hypothetical protein
MSFFGTFSEIAKNQGNFHQWEQDKADQEAKREKYFAQNPISEQEKKQAEEFGRVIIDTVDFMDAQSENKSESIEMFSEMITGLATEFGSIGFMISIVMNQFKKMKSIKEVHKKIDDLLTKLTKDDAAKAILEDLKEHKLIDNDGYRKSILGDLAPSSILDKEKFSKLKLETRGHFSKIITEDVMKQAKKIKGFANKLVLIPAAVALGISTIGQVIGTVLQVKASKIARYQAREELKDTKNFVEYTDEQKAQAQQISENITVPKDKKTGSFKDIRSLMKHYGAYQANSKEMDNVHFSQIEETDPKKAYDRQKTINTCVTKINNTAEEYSENMETSAGIILGSSVLGGAAIGKLTNYIIEQIEKIKNKNAKNTKIIPKKAFLDLPEIPKNAKLFKKISIVLGHIARTNPGTFGGVLAVLITTPIATKLQKNASRAGRYQAKRDLEENPQSFIHVDEQKLNQIDAKGKAKKSGFFDVIKFIPKSIKTTYEYDKYKKNILPKRKLMHEALKQTNISAEQMKKAESLKARLYKSFDVIDDHSQDYSEKMEAATEITKDLMSTATIFASILPMAIISKNPEKFIRPVTGLLSFIFEKSGGFVTKYTKNLSKNMIRKKKKKLAKDYHYKQISFVEKEINELLTIKDRTAFAEKITELKAKLDTKFKNTFQSAHYIELIKKTKGSDFKDVSGLDISKKMIELIGGDASKESTKIYKLTHKFDAILEAQKHPKTTFWKLENEEIFKYKDEFFSAIEEVETTPAIKAQLKELIAKPHLALDAEESEQTIEQTASIMKMLATSMLELDATSIKKRLNAMAEDLGISNIDFQKMTDKNIIHFRDNVVKILNHIPENEFNESFIKYTKYLEENPTKKMMMKDGNIELSLKERFLSKDIKTIVYTLMGTYAAGILGLNYSVDSYMSAKTKEAGRLGTMKAIEQLNQENEQALNIKKAP